mgnify:CR=1 FL=1
MRYGWVGFAALMVTALLVLVLAVSATGAQEAPALCEAAKGVYIFALSGGCGCHSSDAGLLAGGEKFEGPFGEVYASNITPHPEAGIGGWTDQEIIDAIRLGVRPDGTVLFPIMPYAYLSGMSDEDAAELVKYLRVVPPVDNRLPAPQLTAPVPPFTPPRPAPATAPRAGVERGAYLVNALGHCGDCHTPRNPDGSPNTARFLAGGEVPGVGMVPNITSGPETGLGGWTPREVATLLQTGIRPDGSEVRGLMALLVLGGYKQMTDADALAVAAYLQTLAPVENAPPADVTPPLGSATGEGNEDEDPLELLPETGGMLAIP